MPQSSRTDNCLLPSQDQQALVSHWQSQLQYLHEQMLDTRNKIRDSYLEEDLVRKSDDPQWLRDEYMRDLALDREECEQKVAFLDSHQEYLQLILTLFGE